MIQPKLPLLISSLIALSSTSAIAASVPSGTSLAKEQHFVRGNGAEPNTLAPSFVNSGMPGDIIVTICSKALLSRTAMGKSFQDKLKVGHSATGAKLSHSF